MFLVQLALQICQDFQFFYDKEKDGLISLSIYENQSISSLLKDKEVESNNTQTREVPALCIRDRWYWTRCYVVILHESYARTDVRVRSHYTKVNARPNSALKFAPFPCKCNNPIAMNQFLPCYRFRVRFHSSSKRHQKPIHNVQFPTPICFCFLWVVMLS